MNIAEHIVVGELIIGMTAVIIAAQHLRENIPTFPQSHDKDTTQRFYDKSRAGLSILMRFVFLPLLMVATIFIALR